MADLEKTVAMDGGNVAMLRPWVRVGYATLDRAPPLTTYMYKNKTKYGCEIY
jgi:hypothetical protein